MLVSTCWQPGINRVVVADGAGRQQRALRGVSGTVRANEGIGFGTRLEREIAAAALCEASCWKKGGAPSAKTLR